MGDCFIRRREKRTATVKSVVYSDLYRLDTELFDEVLKKYPRIIEQIKKVADERMNQNIGLFKKLDESCSYNRNYNTGN